MLGVADGTATGHGFQVVSVNAKTLLCLQKLGYNAFRDGNAEYFQCSAAKIVSAF